MSSFREQLTAFTANVRATNQAVFVGVVQEAKRSIVEGSELTGSPGQPVDTSFLKGSWIIDFPAPAEATITTNVSYARVIEDNVRAEYDPAGVDRPPGLAPAGGGRQHIKSVVGGNHSVALTVAGFNRIVETVAAREAGSGGGSA